MTEHQEQCCEECDKLSAVIGGYKEGVEAGKQDALREMRERCCEECSLKVGGRILKDGETVDIDINTKTTG